MQCTPIVVKVPFCLLEVGATFGQHVKRRRRGRFTRRHRLLEIRYPGQQFIPCDCQCVALDCKSRAIPLQAIIRRGHVLQFPFGFEIGDFRALNLYEGPINRGESVVKLRSDCLDISKRKFD